MQPYHQAKESIPETGTNIVTTKPPKSIKLPCDKGNSHKNCPNAIQKGPGLSGEKCRTHAACFEDAQFICVKQSTQHFGACKKVF